MTPVDIHTDFHTIGMDKPAYIIAEIGSNHNQNFDMACEMIDKAVDAGANGVKFQTFKAENHYSKYTPEISLYNENIYTLIESLEIDRSWHKKLSSYCRKKKIDFLDSPTDAEAIRIDREIKMPLMKIASFDMVDLHLVKQICKGQNGVIISTGMSSLSEIEQCVNLCRSMNNDRLILLQCTSLYPAPTHLANLQAMETLFKSFNTIVGYSDHTLGDHIAIAAVSIGAKVIEKHYTLDRTLPGPDHGFAIEPGELKEMITKIRDIESAMGNGMKTGPAEEEQELYRKARRSIHSRKDLQAGHVLKSEDLIIKRPATGIHPVHFSILLGRKLKSPIQKDEPVTWEKV